MTGKKPNILFIIIDSARYDHFSLYGYDRSTTPFLDLTADDFVIYENANTPAAWTRPAMASIFTSLYPQQYGFFEGEYPAEHTPVLTGILRANGYRTVILSNNTYMSPLTGFQRYADRFYFVRAGEMPSALDKAVVLKHGLKLLRRYLDRRTSYKVFPEMINEQALRVLRELSSASEPFFVYVHHDAHHPYLSERKYLRQFLGGDYTEEEIRTVEQVQKSGNMYWFNRTTLDPEVRARYYAILRAMHDASIYKNDLMIWKLIRALKASGAYQDTMIIIAADHGEFLGERDLISHGLYLFDESVRVPLLIKYPRGLDLSGRSDRLVSTIDLMPTMLELAGTDVREYISEAQGMSLLSENEHEFVITQRMNFAKGLDFWQSKYPDHDFEQYDYGNSISFKTRKRKFVWASKGDHRLFDLDTDPQETRSVFGDDERSRTYLRRAEEWIDRVPKVTGEPTGEFDEKVREHLRGLGYIE
jgi:uncharacterized sulfatase